jgi:TonB family protein
MTVASRLIRAVVAILLLQAGVAGAQDSLAAARQLYASASYDEALAMLDHLKSGGAADAAVANVIEQYRAFCLLAVGHQPDAERAIETIVASDPAFRPDDTVSPRLQSVFRDVRRRMLPVVVRQRYAGAKASFDQKAYQAAADQFDAVVRLLDSPDVVAADPALADLRTLASGFKDLATAAATPPPPPPVPPAAEVPVAAPSPLPPVPASPAASAPRPARGFYTADDAGVTAPVVVRQDLPPWPKGTSKPGQRALRAVLDIVIDEAGTVESVVVRQSIAPWYDELLVREAKRWSYKPATSNGTPVRYRKMVQVVVEG